MDSNTFIGLFITSLAVIVGLAISIITPILKLNKTITKLNISVENLNAKLEKDEREIQLMHEKLEKHDEYLLIDKKRLDNHEVRLGKLDGNVGIHGIKVDEQR